MCADEDFQNVLERIGRVFHDAAQVRAAIGVFAALDTAGTRRVDAEKLQRGLGQIGVELSAPQLDRLLATFCSGGDGGDDGERTIDYEDFYYEVRRHTAVLKSGGGGPLVGAARAAAAPAAAGAGATAANAGSSSSSSMSRVGAAPLVAEQAQGLRSETAVARVQLRWAKLRGAFRTTLALQQRRARYAKMQADAMSDIEAGGIMLERTASMIGVEVDIKLQG